MNQIIRSSETVQKHEGQISNFYFLISAFRERLQNCDAETREWLPDLVHGLWLARYPVREWTEGGNEAFVQADKEYGNIVDSLEKQ